MSIEPEEHAYAPRSVQLQRLPWTTADAPRERPARPKRRTRRTRPRRQGDVVEVLESVVVASGTGERRIDLVLGDLAHIAPDEAVDILVVSAFPDDYSPTPTSLIGALARAGVSVMDLARDKEEDLREEYGCWLSRPVGASGSVGFRRILCFEPALRGSPPEVVGDIFRCLSAIVHGPIEISRVAMPLVASGDARWPREAIFGPLVDAAIHWLELGLPIDVIQIVERSPVRGGGASGRAGPPEA